MELSPFLAMLLDLASELCGWVTHSLKLALLCCLPDVQKHVDEQSPNLTTTIIDGHLFLFFRQRTQCTMLNISSWQQVLPAGSPASKISCSTTSTPSTPTPSPGARCGRSSYKTANPSTLYPRPSRHPAGDTDSLGLPFFS